MWIIKIKKHKDLPEYYKKDIGKTITLPDWKATRFGKLGYGQLLRHFVYETNVTKCKCCGAYIKKRKRRYTARGK